ncbi:MAG: cell wall hydrolase [Lachnospiraceae bacterium]
MKKVSKSIALILLLCSLSNMLVFATQEKIHKVQEGIEDLKKQKKEAENEVNSYSNQAGNLAGDLEEFNNSLVAITTELNETEEQLDNTRNNLKTTRKALKKAKKKEKKQYEAMKKRIQFIYEMDTDSMLEVLLGAESFADFLNKSEYFISIHNYDREMLEDYRATKDEIIEKEEELEKEENLLAELQNQQESKKQELAELVDHTSEKLSAAKRQLTEAQADVKAYEAEIKRQIAYEAELEAQKAAEDAKRLEEIKRQEAENTVKAVPSNSSSDISILAAIIECEAGGESYEGKLAVGSVVLNRVRSSHFPSTIAGVIYQSGQFSPVASGRFATVLARGANQSCIKAAKEVLGGNITLNSLYFRRNNGTISGTVIGNHVFY